MKQKYSNMLSSHSKLKGWKLFATGIALLYTTAAAQAGDVIWEIFKPKIGLENLSNTTVTPTRTVTLTTLNAQGSLLGSDVDQYESRIKGFLKVAVTGNYKFAMGSDDGAEFYLSTSALPSAKSLVLKNAGYVGSLTSSPTAVRNLEVGKIYYFEILHDEAGGGDFVQVAWNKPGDASEVYTDITATNLLRFGMNFAPTLSLINDPAPVNVNAGTQTINLTGITDGNPETVQNISITAVSSNTNIVSNLVVTPSTINNQTTATLTYDIGSQLGIAEITVTVKDDGALTQSVGTDNYSVKFNVAVRNPALNNSPTFGIPTTTKINVGREFIYILIPNVSDGDDDKDQTLSFTVQSLNPSILSTTGITYVSGQNFATLKVSPLSLGNASIKITAKDNGGVIGGGSDTYERTINFVVSLYTLPGINFEYYDTQHWQELVDDAVAVPGSYQLLQQASTPIRNLARDFFWQRMWGFITPAVTGEYSFRATGSDNNSLFYLSTDANPRNKVIKSDLTGVLAPQNSNPVILTAGKTYYWMAKNADIVSSNEFDVFVAKPNEGFSMLDGSLSSPIFDTVAPTTPKNLTVVTTGINDVSIKWEASSDINFLGYFVYLDGIRLNDTVMKTDYMITGLKSKTMYNIVVSASDKFENISLFSNTISFTTYNADANPPTVPTDIVLTKAFDLGMQISWKPSTDTETEIRGYNIYLNGSTTPANAEIVKASSFQINNLSDRTSYEIRIEAVDAAFNKSAKSIPVRFATTNFTPEVAIPGVKKAQISFNMKGIATSTGMGIYASPGQGILMRNKIKFPGFEAADVREGKETSQSLLLVARNKSTDPADVYSGNRSARITGGAGDFIRAKFGAEVNTEIYNYRVRFAVKKGSNNSPIDIRLRNTWGAILLETTFTPTDNWQLFEAPLNRPYTDADAGMNLEIVLKGNGSIFLDELEFSLVDDDYVVDGKLTPYSKLGMGLLKELKPSVIRWGGIDGNFDKFSEKVGHRQDEFTYADWMNMSNLVGAKTGISVGVYQEYDFFRDSTVFTKFADYLMGDISTEFGKKRIEEEGYTNLISKSPGLILEFGNEVWGGGCLLSTNCGVNHGALQWAGKPNIYGDWARKMSGMLSKSAGYNTHRNKTKTFYSGGFTDLRSFGNWSSSVYANDKGQVDGIAIGGYMGGNLNYTPEVPRGESELDYHKNTVLLMKTFWDQMLAMQVDMLRSTGRVLPMYNYEGNMTRPDYQGRIGQAVNFSDYYVGNMQKGALSSVVFGLFNGGEWRILDGITNKKLALYHSIALFNAHCKGTALETMVASADSLVDDKNKVVKLAPVGAYTYINGSKYSIALYSRDFSNDYRVQLQLPDSIKATKGYTIYTLLGENFQSFDSKVDSTKNSDQSVDSLLITVPKYGITIVTFNANNYVIKAPEEGVLVNNKQSTGIDAISKTGSTVINTVGGSLDILVKILPEDVLSREYRMTIVSNSAGAQISNNPDKSTVTVKENGQQGTVTLRFATRDAKTFSGNFTKEITIELNGAVGIEKANETYNIDIYPNPAKGNFIVNVPETVVGIPQIKIMTMNGVVVSEREGTIGENTIDASNLSKGIYIVKVTHQKGTSTRQLTIL